MSKTFRRPLFAFTLGAALAAAVLLGRAAYADNGTIEACFKPSNGTLYLLGDASSRTACQPGDIPISWNSAGLQGPPGEKGDKGDPGDPFSGMFTSPNNQYRLTVADDGIELRGPNGRVDIDASGISIDSALALDLRGAAAARLRSSGITRVDGSLVQLNGPACAAAARVGDLVFAPPGGGGDAPYPGGFFPILPPGSATVCIGG